MDATIELARRVATARLDDLPQSVQEESVRALIDTLACALGGCLDASLDPLLDTLGTSAAQRQATLIGRGDRIDLPAAAVLTALSGGSLDYDAIHAPTCTRSSVAVAGALLPLAEAHGASGAQLIHAYALGIEVAGRTALALGDGHAARGWNASATSGVIGAAAACAKLLGLDAERTAHALGIAATQASGVDEVAMHSAVDLNLGFAARNGLMAALFAEQGFTGTPHALEGRRGLFAVLSVQARPEALVEQWGTQWQAARLAYRPYPCNPRLHPAIDACLQLRRRHELRPRAIEDVHVRAHPQVVGERGDPQPGSPTAARESIAHAMAVALFDGAAGVRQFQMERVRHARVARLRSRIEAQADPDLARDEVHVMIALQDGRVLEQRQRGAFGSLGRPMADDDLSTKFRNLAVEVLATGQAERMLALAWNVRALGDVGSLVRASVAEDELTPAELPGSPLIPR